VENFLSRTNVNQLVLFLLVVISAARFTSAQTPVPSPTPTASNDATLRYLDAAVGLTSDKAVELALENNGEIIALRKEVESARALIKQAGLRPNPRLGIDGAKLIGGADNEQMAAIMLPLELGGRRAARIAVAQRELEVREFALANQERLLAAEVRTKFGEALATIKKFDVMDRAYTVARQGYDLVTARVTEGKTAPLEQNMLLVEVNRLHALLESSKGNIEIAMFELRNLIGMRPEEPMRLKDEFQDLIAPLPPLGFSTDQALLRRPDLQGVRTIEKLADTRIEQLKSEGRIDASIKGGYRRSRMGFPLSGIDESGGLRPIDTVFRSFTFGIELDLPVLNRNQHAIEAALLDRQAARSRSEFGELTIRREVASAFARYNSAARALAIFQNGVRDQAGSNLQVIWQTYELGSRSLIEYLSEERRYLDIENEFVNAALETYIANIEVMRAVNSAALKGK